MRNLHPTTTGPDYRDADGEPAQLVICPDCGQIEWWTAEELRDHGACRTHGARCPVCDDESWAVRELMASSRPMSAEWRAKVVMAARERGREAAWEDAGVVGGVDTERAGIREYLVYVVEPSWQEGLIDDEDLAWWREAPRARRDPRVVAFAAGWAEESRRILRDLAEA